MKKVLTFILLMMACILQANAQDQINWVPFECTDETSTSYVLIEDRKALFKVTASWPANETRPVVKWINNSYPVSMGNMPGGEYFIVLEHPDETMNPIIGYQSIYIVSLEVQTGNYLRSEDRAVRTEPTPVVQHTADVTPSGNGSLLTINGISHTADTTASDEDGWGGLGIPCTLHEISIITDVFSGNTLIFSDTTFCVPGIPTEFSAEFLYEGPYTQLCTRSRMEKRSTANPATFPVQVITYSDEVCQFAGQETTPTLRWIPWNCESADSVYYVSVGDRTSLVRFEAQWPNNVAYEVKKRFEDGSSESIGMIYGGEHLIDVRFENQLPFGYWRSYHVGLQLVENPDVETSLLFITTEPTPPLEGAVEVVSTSVGDSLILHSTSETELGTGWGGIASECSEHQTYLVHELLSGETSLFRDSVMCSTQSATPPIHELTSRFFYTGEEVELCMRSYMIKVDVSSQPTFVPRTIASDNGDCVTVGKGLPTSITSSSEDERFMVYPNPSTGVFYISNTDSEPWVVTNALGSVVAVGNLAVVDATSWAKGVYIITLGNKNIRMVRE